MDVCSVAEVSEVQQRICLFRKDHGVRVGTGAQSWSVAREDSESYERKALALLRITEYTKTLQRLFPSSQSSECSAGLTSKVV
jgi:hypothetical protein